MVKLRILLFVFLLSLVTSGYRPKEWDFRKTSEEFRNKCGNDFQHIPERRTKSGNDFILENRVKPIWKSIPTLRSRTSFINKYGQKVFPVIYLGFYEYASAKDCQAATDSLMNCFGNDCQPVKWNVKTQRVKTTPRRYLVYEKEIIACHISCEHVEDSVWHKFKYDLAMAFGPARIIEADCGGPVYFRKF